MTSGRHAVAAGAIALVLLAGCGSDGESSEGGTAAGTVDTGSDVGSDAVPTPTETSTPSGSTVTGADICSRLVPESVAADLDLDVTGAVADESGTPQCAYEYTNESGATSNLTVAFMRPDDVAGRVGVEAYEFTLGVNRAFAGDDEQDVDAGDAAVRLSGSGIHVGVLLVGDEVYTVLVPAGDADPASVEALLATMATSLG